MKKVGLVFCVLLCSLGLCTQAVCSGSHPFLSSFNCAETAVSIVATARGIDLERISFQKLKSVNGEPISIGLIKEVLEDHGVSVKAVHADVELFLEVGLIVIFHFEIEGEGHYSVGRILKEREVELYDPLLNDGETKIFDYEEIDQIWSGYAVLVK